MSYLFGYNYLTEKHILGYNYKKWEYLYECDYRVNYNNTIYYLDMYGKLYKYKDGNKASPTDCYLELVYDNNIKNNINNAIKSNNNIYITKIKQF